MMAPSAIKPNKDAARTIGRFFHGGRCSRSTAGARMDRAFVLLET